MAFSLYALVDAAMSDAVRARGVSKPVWVVLTVVLPVIGGILWFTIGKGPLPAAQARRPDDDPRFSGTRMGGAELDAHMRELEERLRELDQETFPGEDQQGGAPEAPGPEAPDVPGAAGSNGKPGPTGTDDPPSGAA